MSVKERLEQFCEYRGISIGAFCREAKISNSYFSNVKGPMGTSIRGKIKKAYEDLNITWLITGEGDMLNTTQAAVITPYPVEDAEVIVAEGDGIIVKQPPVVPDKVVRDPNVSVLDWVEEHGDEHTQSAFNFIKILQSTKCIIQMNNNAMASALYQGEFVFLKPFAEDSEIIDGEIYGIETKERGILIRFLYDDGDYYLARPKNTREFGDIRIPKSKVVELYHIKFRGSMHLSSIPDNEADMVKQLGKQSEYISSLIGQLDKAGDRVDKMAERVDRMLDIMSERK